MSNIASCLYLGTVAHQRLKPMRHDLRYNVYSLLIGLDELPRLDRGSVWFGYNRPALLGFYDRDHGARDGTPLRLWIASHLDKAGLADAAEDISLLCFPRVLGYVFNPLSIYFCRDKTGRLRAILYEVKNTFGEQHGYLFPVDAAANRSLSHGCAKQFYVSPFIGMQANYVFDIAVPGDDFSLLIREATPDGETLRATWRGRRVAWSERALRRCFWKFPLLGFRIMAGIHWHALRLWLKKAKFYARPARPAEDVSIIERGPSHD